MSSRKTENSLRILGIMTGTSCDGIDVACIDINLHGWVPLWSQSRPYSKQLRNRVLEIQKPKTKHSLHTWLELHRDLGEWYGSTLHSILKKTKPNHRPHLISNHGQTVGHFPSSQGKGMSLQLGNPSHIAYATGLTVATQFREGDMAAGGEGAPLVPIFHRLISRYFKQRQKGVAIHNIGGISNLTYIAPDESILAFDTGPGNIWIDAATEKVTRGKFHFDSGGKLASQGKIDPKAIHGLLQHPFFKQKPPKSTGRDDFPFQLFLSQTQAKGSSLVSTATEFTALTIALAYQRWILEKRLPLHAIYLCGGGSKNPVLVNRIKSHLTGIAVHDLKNVGLDPQYIEAQAFAVFGFFTLMGHPLGGAWTGAHGFGSPGHLIPGKNWTQLISILVNLN